MVEALALNRFKLEWIDSIALVLLNLKEIAIEGPENRLSTVDGNMAFMKVHAFEKHHL